MDKQRDFVLRTIEERGVKFVRLWFTDVVGTLKSVAIAPAEVEGAFTEGIGFDGSAIEGLSRTFESDLLAFPDPTTFQTLPWRGDIDPTARMFCDITTPDGEPAVADPRNVLKRTLARAADRGFTFYTHPEIEFYLLKSSKYGPEGPQPVDSAGYFDNVSEAKPLLHLWSLGIEEQFYLLWPTLLLVAWRARRALFVVIAVLFSTSFVYNALLTRSDEIAAFYSPATRLWELLLGGGFAYLTLSRTRATFASRWTDRFWHLYRPTIRGLGGAVGLAAVIASAARCSPSSDSARATSSVPARVTAPGLAKSWPSAARRSAASASAFFARSTSPGAAALSLSSSARRASAWSSGARAAATVSVTAR